MAAVGGAQRPLGDDRIDKIGDVAGYNGDGANIADFQQPGIPSVVTEYGSTLAERPGKYMPGWGDLARDEGWKGREWRSGQAIWCGFDHGSIFGESMARLGIVDYFRLPKRSWYWYRNEYGHRLLRRGLKKACLRVYVWKLRRQEASWPTVRTMYTWWSRYWIRKPRVKQ